jgi:hypothetical protein
MTKIFTQDDVIRYLYNELSEEEKNELVLAMTRDHQLLALYEELAALTAKLDRCMMEPSKKTIDSVIKYSKALDLPPVHK